jgi:hypothetical protein
MIFRHHLGTTRVIETVLQIPQREPRIVDRAMTRVDATLCIHAQICRAGAAWIWTMGAAVYLVHGNKKVAEWISSAGKDFGQCFLAAGAAKASAKPTSSKGNEIR